MKQDINDKIYFNNNNLLVAIVNDLHKIINNSHDNLIIKRIGDIINKMNIIINDNKKNTELIIGRISLLKNQMNSKLDKLNINNNNPLNNQVINYKDGRYVGQILNGLREGKGIKYWNDGARYEGDWKNDKREGKGIFYWKNGDIYEGDWRNDKIFGKGIIYYNDGNREMGDYYDGKPIRIHAVLTKNGEVKSLKY